MKIIEILNELYNNNKLESKRFKTPDGTILNNIEALLDYVGVSDNEWYSLTDLIETLQSEVEIIEEVEDKEYEDIDEAEYLEQGEYIDYASDYEVKFDIVKNRRLINALIRNQQKIIKQLENK